MLEISYETTPCTRKKRPQYSRHNFNKFNHSFVIFGKNHPDTSAYQTIRKFSQKLATLLRGYVEMTSDMTSSKMSFRDKDRHLTKAFQMEKHDTARQLPKEHANRNWSRR